MPGSLGSDSNLKKKRDGCSDFISSKSSNDSVRGPLSQTFTAAEAGEEEEEDEEGKSFENKIREKEKRHILRCVPRSSSDVEDNETAKRNTQGRRKNEVNGGGLD